MLVVLYIDIALLPPLEWKDYRFVYFSIKKYRSLTGAVQFRIEILTCGSCQEHLWNRIQRFPFLLGLPYGKGVVGYSLNEVAFLFRRVGPANAILSAHGKEDVVILLAVVMVAMGEVPFSIGTVSVHLLILELCKSIDVETSYETTDVCDTANQVHVTAVTLTRLQFRIRWSTNALTNTTVPSIMLKYDKSKQEMYNNMAFPI